ncbi:MAG: glycosyltransferase family 2 protein [Allobaculum sp.]|nr:glycosyltransferase family 2 protein [Allobaculum sp.]
MSKISIIIPCYNEQEMIPLLSPALDQAAQNLSDHDFEFLLIDDGSKDGTLQALRDLAKKDERFKYISFSRNFGKEGAIYAGLQNASGDLCVIMDADLQDPPELLQEMVKAIEEDGYDSCATRRVTRKGEPPIRSFFAHSFYHLMNKISDVDMVDGARDYRMMNRPFVEAILELPEYNRFSKGIFGWVGYKTKWLEYENLERAAGETKWSFWKLFKYAISGIVSFTTAPLQLASILGILFSLLAFIMIGVIAIRTLCFGDPVSGWPSLICVVMLLGGLQLLSIGILGEYLAKTYLETKSLTWKE